MSSSVPDHSVRDRLDVLERAARPLEPSADERERLSGLALAHAERFLGALPDAPAYVAGDAAFADGLAREMPETGREAGEVLAYLAASVDQPGIATASPRFMGYIPGGGLFHSALGDFLAAVSNKYAGFAPAGPGAVRLENQVVAWLAHVIGFPASATGTLTSGGSIANLTAIVAARDAKGAGQDSAIYTSDYAHHCIDKALHIAGMGGAPRRTIPVDARYRLRADALAEAVEKDLAEGLRPWLVVASAGTVDVGAVDPLPEIAEICRRRDLWFHIDGAYGGLFALCDEGRSMLACLEQADSVALDPHKTLYLPYGTGAVLARDGANLARSFGASADYMRPFSESPVGPSPSDLSPELTRHFRALRLWLPLQIAGVAAFRAATSEKIWLARYFHQCLEAVPGFETAGPPDLSVVAFRYRPAIGDTDDFNDRLLARLQQDGRVFLSGTRLGGHAWLRCAINSFRTHRAHVEEAIEAVTETAEQIARES